MKKFTTLALIASLAFIFTSCSDDETTPTASNMELITKSAWKISTMRISDDNGATWEDLTSIFDPCALDNTFTFKSTGVVVTDEGPTKCDVDDPQTEEFSWSFTGNETKIIIDGDEAEINTLSSSTLKITTNDVELIEQTFIH